MQFSKEVGMDSAPGIGRLEVRSRQVTSRDGWSVAEFTVYCPFRQRSVELDQCEECFAHEITTENADGTPKEIACRRIGPALDLPAVAETIARATLERTPVSRVMARHVVCVHADLPLCELTGIVLRHDVSSVPVVDEESRPIGMLTKTDLIRHGFEIGADDREEVAVAIPRRAGLLPATVCVAEVMTPSVTSLGERASLIEAAQLLAEQGVHCIAVTARDGRVVGIVSSLDVLRWLSRELPSGEGVAGAVELE